MSANVEHLIVQLTTEMMEEIRGVGDQIRRRVAIGAAVSERRLVDELVSPHTAIALLYSFRAPHQQLAAPEGCMHVMNGMHIFACQQASSMSLSCCCADVVKDAA